MQIHTLKRNTSNKKARQVGRGGKRGKTSGRGGKGQTARAGNKRRPELRDIIKKLPKKQKGDITMNLLRQKALTKKVMETNNVKLLAHPIN